MYTLPEKRQLGIASLVLQELEERALQLHFEKCILETGCNQPEAIAIYKKNNYSLTPNIGQYKDSANSICFEKNIVPCLTQ